MRDWSTLPKQSILSGEGRVGDCWRTCIAAVIDVPAQQVPHFALENSCQADTQRWLNERGFLMVAAPKLIFHRWHGDTATDVPLITCGPTERSRGLGKHHAVVTVADKIVFDPHPSEAGLTLFYEQFLITKIP